MGGCPETSDQAFSGKRAFSGKKSPPQAENFEDLGIPLQNRPSGDLSPTGDISPPGDKSPVGDLSPAADMLGDISPTC